MAGGSWRRILAQFFFPARCAHCKAPLRREEGAGGGAADGGILAGLVCPECAPGIVPIAPPLCDVCGVPFASPAGPDRRCGACIERPPAFRKARSAVAHEGAVASVMHAFKYRGRLRYGRALGELAFGALVRFWDRGEIDLAMPVPLHPARRRRRGFNQSRILMDRWPEAGRRCGPDWAELPRRDDVLRRHRNTPRQTGLGRAERRANIRNAFSVPRPGPIEGRRVLVVDDVFTTGATLESCARALLAGGAASVDALTVSRALRRMR